MPKNGDVNQNEITNIILLINNMQNKKITLLILNFKLSIK